MTQEISSLSDLRATVHGWRTAGQTVALVPTMGALHAGHVALMEHAKKCADKIVVSIFVNPTQFGPNEDFARYPRPLADDLAALRAAGADAAWLPSVATMYPDGFATRVRVAGISEVLDGISRPGHFDGVATVVTKLLNQVTPQVALFGEKDYQQLCLIKRLVSDLDMDIRIIGVATQREESGLAMSSRNRYLSDAQRAIAPALYAQLHALSQKLVLPAKAGIHVPIQGDSRLRRKDKLEKLLHQAKQSLLSAGFDAVDYLELRDVQTLAALEHYRAPARLLVAARLGDTRLIDNIAVE